MPCETRSNAAVAAVSANAPPVDNSSAVSCSCRHQDVDLAAAVASLTATVARIEANFKRPNAYPRHRSRSRPRRPAQPSPDGQQALNSGDANTTGTGYCWYHLRFGADAQRCHQPCTWQAGN